MHYNADKTYLFVNGKEIFKFKAGNKNVNLLTQFYFGSISNGFRAMYLFIYLFSLYLTLTEYRKQKNTCLQLYKNIQ